MVERAPTGVGILYLAPIKALLNNQADRFQHGHNNCIVCTSTLIALVELARKRWVEPVEIIGRNWAVLVQQIQILAMTIQFGAVSPEDCWQQLSIDRLSSFGGTTCENSASIKILSLIQ